jgi:hypothetical protein
MVELTHLVEAAFGNKAPGDDLRNVTPASAETVRRRRNAGRTGV